MFTGLIETVQPLRSNVGSASGRRLTLPLGPLAVDARRGDSIAVNGVCLTISRLSGDMAEFDVMAETARVSTLAKLPSATLVNLERAMAVDGRFGGHLVQGHVDGIGTVERTEHSGETHVLWIAAETELMDLMIPKGSVAIDGVSLTLVEVEKNRFSVCLIPTTLNDTNLRHRRIGDRVNLEADLVSKWIKKRLDEVLPQRRPSRVTMKQLRDQGFI